MNVLARREGRKRHFAMNGIWRRDRDNLNIRVIDERLPIGSPAAKTELLGGLLRRVPIDICNRLQNRTQAARENAGNGPIGKAMGLAHEAGADDAYANITHVVPIPILIRL